MKARAKTKDNPTMNIYKFETRCSQQTELSNSKPCQKRSETDRFLAIIAHPTTPKRSFRFSLPLIYRGDSDPITSAITLRRASFCQPGNTCPFPANFFEKYASFRRRLTPWRLLPRVSQIGQQTNNTLMNHDIRQTARPPHCARPFRTARSLHNLQLPAASYSFQQDRSDARRLRFQTRSWVFSAFFAPRR